MPGNIISFMLLVALLPNVSMSPPSPPSYQTNLSSCWDPSYMLQISQRGSSTQREENREEKQKKNSDLRLWFQIGVQHSVRICLCWQYDSLTYNNVIYITHLKKKSIFEEIKSISIIWICTNTPPPPSISILKHSKQLNYLLSSWLNSWIHCFCRALLQL